MSRFDRAVVHMSHVVTHMSHPKMLYPKGKIFDFHHKGLCMGKMFHVGQWRI